MAIEKIQAQIVPEVDQKASKQAEAELRRLTSPTGIKLAADLANLRQQLSLIKGQIRLAEQQGNFTAAIKLRTDAEVISKQITSANRSLVNFARTGNTELSAFQKTIGGVSNSLTGFVSNIAAGYLSVVGLARALKGVSDIGRSFETAFTGVQKTVNLSATDMEKLRLQLLQLSKEIPVSFEALSAIASTVGQLGISGDQITQFTKTIALLGVTTNLSSEEAAFALARFQTQLKVSGDDIDNVGAAIVALGNNFATTERDIVAFAERITGVGSIVGLSAQEVLAISTAFTSVGIEAEAGATAVQKAFLDINTAVNTGSKDLQKFATISGMTATEFAKLFKEDAGVAFQKFVQGLSESGTQAGQVLEELGLADARQQRAFLSLAAAGGELERALNLANLAFADNVALQKEAENRFKTVDSQLQIQTNRWKALFAVIGGSINSVWLPIYKEITYGATVALPFFFDVFKAVFSQTGKILIGYRDVAIQAFRDIGDSAKIIPYAIQGALNLGISAFGKFINVQLMGINLLIKGLQKIPGMSSLKTIDANALLPKIDVVEAPKFLGNFKDTFIKNIQELNIETTSMLKKREDQEEIFIEKQKGRLAQEVKADQEKVQQLLAQNDKKNKGINSAENKAAKDKKTLQQDALKNSKAVFEEEIKYQENLQKEYEETIKTLKKGLEEIQAIQEKIAELNSETSSKIADRYTEIGEKIADIKEKLVDFGQAPRQLAEALGKESLANMQGDTTFQVGGADVTVKDLREILKLQEELAKLTEEQSLAKKNTTEEDIKGSQSSETEKILAEAEKRKKELEQEQADIETRIGFKEEAAKRELEILEKAKDDNSKAIQAYKDIVAVVEKEITAVTKAETDQRLALYAQEERRLRDLIALRLTAGMGGNAAGVTNTTNNNNSTAIVNVDAKISGNVDADKFSKKLATDIQNAQKWVN